MRLNHIAVVSQDEEKARRFYEKYLGMREVKKYEIDGSLTESIFGINDPCTIIFYENENFSIEVFIPSHYSSGEKTLIHNCLMVKNQNSFLEEGKRQGITIKKIPKGEKFLIFIEDFDGNLFEIKEG